VVLDCAAAKFIEKFRVHAAFGTGVESCVIVEITALLNGATPRPEPFCPSPPITPPVAVELGPVTHVGQAIVPVVVMVPPVIGPVVAMLVTVPHGPPAS